MSSDIFMMGLIKLYYRHILTFATLVMITHFAILTASASENIPKFTDIKTGLHTIALGEDGTVWAWGFNYMGSCGAEENNKVLLSPYRVPGLNNINEVGTYLAVSVALRDDGTVWTWGDNTYGQLGIGIVDPYRYVPQQVVGLTNVTHIACGNNYVIALKDDGTVWAWGDSNRGKLGDGWTFTMGDKYSKYNATPGQVIGLSNVTRIFCSGGGNSLAIKDDGTVWAWGLCSNYWGDWEGKDEKGYVSIPVQIYNNSSFNDIKEFSPSGQHILMLKKDGTVWAMGENIHGNLGEGNQDSFETPVQVKGLKDIISIYTGEYHSIALDKQGNIYTWGFNDEGQIGDGTTITRKTPYKVNIYDVKQIHAGSSRSFAMDNNGNLWAWGSNPLNQLGNGCQGDGLKSTTPIKIDLYKDSTSTSPTPTSTVNSTATPSKLASATPEGQATSPAPNMVTALVIMLICSLIIVVRENLGKK